MMIKILYVLIVKFILHLINDSIPSSFQIMNYWNQNTITIGLTGNATLMSFIDSIEFESLNNAIWENLIHSNNIIYIDINYGEYLISFFINEIDDINQDGVWDILDIVLLVSFILEDSFPTNFQFESADLNNDNQLNIYDIILLVNNVSN